MPKTNADYDLGLYVETDALASMLRGCMGVNSGGSRLDTVVKELNRPLTELKGLMKHFEATGETTVAEFVEAIEAHSKEVRLKSQRADERQPEPPTKPCPECGTRIHARATNHECGWTTFSKMEAVRKVLNDVGEDADPKIIKRELKKRFGLTVTPTVASSYKTVILTTRQKRRAARLKTKG